MPLRTGSLLTAFLLLTGVLALGPVHPAAAEDRGAPYPVATDYFTYPSEGLEIGAFVARPDTADWRERKWPLIVYNHGDFNGLGPELGALRMIAAGGAVVAASEYRGEGGSQGEIEFADGEVDDVAALLELMRNKSWTDPEREAMAGFSHGGLITLKLLQRGVELDAAVLAATPWDLTGMDRLESGDWKRGWISEFVGCDITECPSEYRERSALGPFEEISAPVLMVHGERDRIYPVELADRLAERMRRAGVDLRYLRPEGLDHEVVLVYEFGRVLDFLERELGGFGPG